MIIPGNYGTFIELDAAAEIFNFAGYIVQLNAEGSYNCYNFGFSNVEQINKSKAVVHLLFTGSPDEGHFRFLKPISVSSQMATGRYNPIPLEGPVDDQYSLSITNEIIKKKES